jgi:manganese/zinc/iron transport system permease protein
VSSTLVILLVGAFVAASCALVGTFLVLRRMSLLGDAISHAVLPGIVIAFMLTGTRSSLPMLIGAGVLGLVTVALVELFNRTRRLREDASIGVVFPALFSLGVILVTRYTASVDLDLDCVLYGEIAFTPLDLLYVGDTSLGPRALWITGIVLLVNVVFVWLLFKELKLATFDAGLAASLGFSPVLVHYLLMGAVSLTVVGSFDAVGAILVVAMLITPPATAYLLTDRLGTMLGLSVLIGVGASSLGYGAARLIDCSIAGAMAAAAGALFLLALLFSPRHGVVARALRHRRLGEHMDDKILLSHLDAGPFAAPESALRERFTWSEAHFARTAERLVRAGLAARLEEGLTLTAQGKALLASTQLPVHPPQPTESERN